MSDFSPKRANPAKSNIAVVGAGLVGACAALVLARQGFRITLIEPRAPKLQIGRLGMDLRHISLSPASQTLLTEIGIWQDLKANSYQHMHVWEQWGTDELHFSAAEIDRDEIGWLSGMSSLALALWQACEANSSIKLCIAATRSVDIQVVSPNTSARGGAVQITLDDGSNLEADFLIAADGGHSTIRRLLDLEVVQKPTGHFALATAVRTEHAHQSTAWQRFLLDGPVALLPGADAHVCSIVWSQSENQALNRRDCEPQAFCQALEHATESRLGKILEVDERIVFPISQQRVKSCAPHHRVLFIGDAMRVVHPLAGLGVNLGFEDVAHMSQITQIHADLAQSGLWTRYDRQRQARSRSMIKMLDMLRTIYAAPGPMSALLRNTGVRAINNMPGLKRQIMREAQGLGPLGR